MAGARSAVGVEKIDTIEPGASAVPKPAPSRSGKAICGFTVITAPPTMVLIPVAFDSVKLKVVAAAEAGTVTCRTRTGVSPKVAPLVAVAGISGLLKFKDVS